MLSARVTFLGTTLLLLLCLLGWQIQTFRKPVGETLSTTSQQRLYWFLLHRASNVEFLYIGVPGDAEQSQLLKTFTVKSGIPGERPTPLPQLVGRDYWLLVDKFEQLDNPETAPYFLTLDIPFSEDYPYGPVPYEECGGQCDWVLPGAFGLHGVASDASRLSPENAGSSGCIRHSDEDIAYLYHLLDPKKEAIRYYVEDI